MPRPAAPRGRSTFGGRLRDSTDFPLERADGYDGAPAVAAGARVEPHLRSRLPDELPRARRVERVGRAEAGRVAVPGLVDARVAGRARALHGHARIPARRALRRA